MKNFKNVFKNLRISSGYTQLEFAKKLGISRSTIGMYETGAREPDYETLEKIADFFNVDIDFLLGRTDKTTILPNSSYYYNEDAREMAQFFIENPDFQNLFSIIKKSSNEDIKLVTQMLKRLNDDIK